MQTKKEDIRKKILNVSERMFIRNGYENTSLQMIADRCYISKSNIYRYFKSKDEIYETLVSPAREAMQKAIMSFTNGDYAGKYTPDKIVEISDILAKMMSEFRSGFLIILNYSEGADLAMLKDLQRKQFLAACPIDDTEFKSQIVELLLLGLTDILLKHDKEDEIRERLRLLWSYHYRGLNGVKQELGVLF